MGQDPQPISQLASSLTVRRAPLEIPYLLSPAEEVAAIESHVTNMKSLRRWSILDRGASDLEADDILLEVKWSEEFDRDAVLDKANRLKYWEGKDAEIAAHRQHRLMGEYDQLIRTWTAERMYQRLASRCYDRCRRDLIVNEHTLPLIKVLCYRLSYDTRFVTELHMDPFKGLLLRGDPGKGKTFLVDCLADNPRTPIQMHTLLEISERIRDEGRYSVPPLESSGILYLDDVGTEEVSITHYGTKTRWFKTFIETYYSKRRGDFSKLIISTNDSFDQLQEKYGLRVRSRLAEMFNIIDITGPDLRKN